MKFSIVTPVYNGEEYIAQTIESVISQEGDFEIEYIIQDSYSTDKTPAIIQSYINRIKDKTFAIKCKDVKIFWNQEKDVNMNDGANRGAKKSHGDIYAMIPADDIYLPNAFRTVQSAIQKFPEIEWLTGITNIIDNNNKTSRMGECLLYSQKWLTRGIYGRNSYFVPQNATFWTASLWKRSGQWNENLRYAGDYALWTKFSSQAKLWSINFPLSSFRKRQGQLSGNISGYKDEQQTIIFQTKFTNFFIRVFFSLQSRSNPHFQKIFLWLYRVIFLEKDAEYVDFEKGIPIKKPAYSFIVNYRK